VPAEKRDLAGSVVAITGASAGIGQATARLLAEAGALVVLGARRTDRLEALVAEIGPDRALAVEVDVRDPEQCRQLVRRGVERFGRLDSMVANAGIGRYGGIEDGSDDDMTAMLDVNVAGTVWAVRAAVPELKKAGGGDIVIVSSVAGLRGDADEAVYAATKFAQVGLAGAVDRELRQHGIRVSAICPAGVNTEFALGTGRTEGDPALEQLLQPEDVAFQVNTVLEQPRRLRTTLWVMWNAAHGN
jgi:NADP-dependent 3-hydroxy acid dehydrogenase YdfG